MSEGPEKTMALEGKAVKSAQVVVDHSDWSHCWAQVSEQFSLQVVMNALTSYNSDLQASGKAARQL